MSLLVDLLGPVAAAAVEAGVRAVPKLGPAVLPRAALAWARAVLPGGYDGPAPGRPDVTVLTKAEGHWGVLVNGSTKSLAGVGDAGLAAALLALNDVPAVDARAPRPALVRLGKSLDLLVKGDLEKRSKNVREATRNITPLQAMQRRVKYAQSIGLDPRKSTIENPQSFPQSDKNKITFDPVFGLDHELAHASMTAPGQTVREHEISIDPAVNPPGRPPGFDSNRDENIAQQVENHIDRRVGVNTTKFQSGARTPLRADNPLRALATPHVAKFDAGHKFDQEGRLHAPTGVDAAINTGTGGVAGLKARLGKSEGLEKARGREGAGPAAAPQAPGAPVAPSGPTTGAKAQPVATAPKVPGMKPPAAPGAAVPKAAAGVPKPAKPKVPRMGKSLSFTKSELVAFCPACGKTQLEGGRVVGCLCWSTALVKSEIKLTPTGAAIRFGDPDEALAFVEAVRRGK